MAGIGFKLSRLFEERGVLPLFRAYSYSAAVTIGPMLLGGALLLGASFAARLAGMGERPRGLANSMMTYSLLFSLALTSFYNMVLTRYAADMLYLKRPEKVMDAFYGSLSVLVPLGGLIYGVFLCFSGVRFSYGFAAWWLAMILIVIWTEILFLTAVRDFRSIVLAFATAMLAGFLLSLVLVIFGVLSVFTLLLGVIFSFGLMMLWYYQVLLSSFPKGEGESFSFYRWLDRFHQLRWIGALVNCGLFSHIIIMYFGPLKERAGGLFFGAPQYDVPALAAFFSILITNVTFVTSVEVKFYPAYRRFYDLFDSGGILRDLEAAREEMLRILSRELFYCFFRQAVCSSLFIALGEKALRLVLPGISELAVDIFMFLCVGYGLYAAGNCVMLILLYFGDYSGALLCAAVFGLTSAGGTIWQIRWGTPSHFGAAFAAAAFLYFAVGFVRLEWCTRRLEYLLLGRRGFVDVLFRGQFERIGDKLGEVSDYMGRLKHKNAFFSGEGLWRHGKTKKRSSPPRS